MMIKNEWEGFRRHGVPLDDAAFRREGARIKAQAATTPPPPTKLDPDTIEMLNTVSPADVWAAQCLAMPEMMKRVEVMLLEGATPEWIMMRAEFEVLPIEIQTAIINAFHWKQAELRART